MDCSHFFGVEIDAAIFIFSRLRKSLANLSVDLVSRALRILESNTKYNYIYKNIIKCIFRIYNYEFGT